MPIEFYAFETLAALPGIRFFGGVLKDLLSYNRTDLFDAPLGGFIAAHRVAWLTPIMQATILPATGFKRVKHRPSALC